MRIVSFSARPDDRAARRIEHHDSIGAFSLPLATADAGVSLVCIRLEAGGVLGRHQAASNQLFCVLQGAGSVSGSDGVAHAISAGQAALWMRDEWHETRSESGLTALVLEGGDLWLPEPTDP
jgi:hypothetical protein